MMQRLIVTLLTILLLVPSVLHAQRYSGPDGKLRVALVKQPFSPNGTSVGPNTMANGGIQQLLAGMGAVVRVSEAALTPDEAGEYGGWKKLGMALGHFADIVANNERDGYFTVGLLATCPSINKVPNGPSSEQLAALFEAVFRRYPKASAIGFATIPATDQGGLSVAAVNRMIAGAIRGVKAREGRR